MSIVSLDQNKWIELAKAQKEPEKYPEEYKLFEKIVGAVKRYELLLPLTIANLYETYKISNTERRENLALFQSTLSRGLVFVGRRQLLLFQLDDYFQKKSMLKVNTRREPYFLSEIHWEAFSKLNNPDLKLSKKHIDLIRKYCLLNPQHAMYEHLTGTGQIDRKQAVQNWSVGGEKLLEGIEKRRLNQKSETKDMRSRIYSASLLAGDLGFLNDYFETRDLFSKMDEKSRSIIIKELIDNVPIYKIERDLAVRLESHTRRVNENDLRDMQHFSVTIPVADCVIGEKFFMNLAAQSRLGETYNTKISRSIFDIRKFIR